jgi:hypothetical protein
MLSAPLYNELHYERYATYLRSLSIFRTLASVNVERNRSTSLMHKIASKAISRIILAREDVLFHRGDFAENVYCVEDGALKYHHPKEDASVTAQDWISEAVLWCSWVHMGMMSAVSECHMFVMDWQISAKTLATQPDTWEIARKHAERFVVMLNSQDVHALTDVMPPLVILERCGAMAINSEKSAVSKPARQCPWRCWRRF